MVTVYGDLNLKQLFPSPSPPLFKLRPVANLQLQFSMLLTCRSGTDKLQLTHEQVRIIKHDVKDGELIKIVAFAGIVLNNL